MRIALDCLGGTKGEGFFAFKRLTYIDGLKITMDEKRIRNLLSSTTCHSCGQHYEAVRISVLKHRRAWLLSLHCPGCNRRCSAFVSLRPYKPSEVVGELN